MVGVLKGEITVSRYETLIACQRMLESSKAMISRGVRGVEAEEGLEKALIIFQKHEENIREMMREIRFDKAEKAPDQPGSEIRQWQRDIMNGQMSMNDLTSAEVKQVG